MTPDELKAHREVLGLSQAELARLLDVPRLHLWRWEDGRYKVPLLMPMVLRGVEATLQERQRRRRRTSKKTDAQMSLDAVTGALFDALFVASSAACLECLPVGAQIVALRDRVSL